MLEFVSFRPLWWLAAATVLAAVAARYSLSDRPRLLRWMSDGLSAAAVLCLIAALCRPYLGVQSDRLHVTFLVDLSQSIDLQKAEDSLGQVDSWIGGLRPGDGWSLFAVGRGIRQFETTEELRGVLAQWRTGLADDDFRSATRLAEGLLEARAAFPAGKARRVVLLTDGQETDGDLAAALRQAREEGIDVQRHPVEGLAYPEAAVVSVAPSPREAFHGEVVRISARLASNRNMPASARLVHKGVAIQTRDVQLQPGDMNYVHFDADMITPGETLWSVELLPAEDHFPVNNQAACDISVRGRPRLLALHAKPKEMRSIVRALREQDLEIELRSEHGLPETLEGLASFDALVLADMPATSMTPRQMQMIKRYVEDLGGGLVMLGSENSFGLGGYYKTPVEDVLPLISRFEKEKQKPSLAMVLVIDKSGSMTGQPIELARQAAKSAVELLSPQDSIGVVGFDGQPQIICEMTSAASKDSVQAAIDSLQADGGTFMYPAMVAAKEMLETAHAKIRHMICLSDGQTHPADHETLAQQMADQGITVSTVALGEADRHLMARIAELGRGRYYETNDPANVPQIFTKETMQAAQSAIKEDLYGCVQINDHPLLTGIDAKALPLTLGYVMTEAKPATRLLLAVETGDPLLAVGRYGLGAGMAYTSDLTERWGDQWLAWDGCGKFWAQALRAVLRKNSVEGLRVETRRAADRWVIDIHRRGDDGLPINGINWDAALLDEDGRAEPLDLQETGLGRYRLEILARDKSRFTVRLRDADHDKTKVLHFHRPYPAEYQLWQSPPPAFAGLPPADRHSIAADLPRLIRRRPIADYFYFAAIAALLGSVLMRRV